MTGSKMQLSSDQRKLVVDLVSKGESYREVQRQTGIAFTTVASIMKKYKKFGTTDNIKGNGRKRITTPQDDRSIIRMVKKDRFISVRKIQNVMENDHGIQMSASTIKNRIHEEGFVGCVAKKKPFLSAKHMKRRLQFAKKYVDMPISFWKKIIWSDESKFNKKTSDGMQKVWRKPGETYRLSCMRGTVKHGGGNIMVWGCMSWKGVGQLEFIDDKMNADLYINILKKNLKASARKFRLGRNFIFQQDNDPKHCANKTKEYFEKNGIEVLEWPAQSPDLNPIEHLWALLDREIGPRSYTRDDNMKNAVLAAWSKINPKQIQTLVESMPRRLAEVIAAKGGPTRY